MQPENPRVFVSHASEDKERFVLEFATRLRSKGVDAWVDRWEMLPGDSLVTKIFEEGIKDAQAMIVVISEHSIGKKWVRAELNAGVVNQIEQASRLIPVIIGNVNESEIPQSLKDTLWERITDLDNYDTEFQSIMRSIYGLREKPELGDPPAYTRMTIDTIPGLDDVDTLILKICCEAQLKQESLSDILKPQTIFEQAEKMEIQQDEVLETLQVLDGRGYVKLTVSAERNLLALRPTNYGFGEYARTYMPDYDSAFRTVALDLVNNDRNDSRHVVQTLGMPAVLVEHVLNEFETRGYIGMQTLGSGVIYIHTVSPELKRWLRGA
jgi:hypothetical protein